MALSVSDRALGDLLVGRRIITLPQLDEAAGLAEQWDVRLGDAILSRHWFDPASYYQGIATYYELPFVDLIAQPPDESLLQAADADTYARTLTIPWMRRDGQIVIATADPGPETVLFARQRWGNLIEFVVVTKFDIVWSVQTVFAGALSRRAVFELAEKDPEMSARTVVTPVQAILFYLFFTLLFGGFALAPIATLIALNVLLSVFNLGNFLFKGVLVVAGGGRSTGWNHEIEIAARALRDDQLPVYTVLVPMFREGAVLPKLAQSLRALDYPLGKLDIKIVLEDGDTETIEAARQLGLEGVFEVIRVPPSQPQTKPKACNFALRFARGEYLVVYDAEDQPEPDQLRKVVATFQRSAPEVACLQCRLNYFNADENWLSRMFTLDYSLWFDLILPGLERLNIPIPLGGTSNHFRIDVLRELHAWDPFNVTEDADLGIRISQKGYRVGIVEFDDLRRSELPRRQLDPPTLAMAQGLHADAAGAHAPARPSHPHHRPRRLSRLHLLHRRHGDVRAVQSAVLATVCGLACAQGRRLRRGVSAIPAVHQPVQSAGRQRCLHLPQHDRADAARLAIAHSFQSDGVRLLGADLNRRVQGVVATHHRSVLLGENPARRVEPRLRAPEGGAAMIRVLDGAPVAFFSFVTALMLASAAIWHGFLPNDAISLWAGAIIAGDGQISIGRIVAAYPTIPFLATAALEYIAPAGTPTPALLAATLIGLLAGIWFVALRGVGLSLVVAGAATAMLIFHPALLRAAIGGPSEMLVAVSLFVLANALFDLRARGAAPEVMVVALMLLVLAFSHPMGAAIACAAVPYLVFAVRPALVANSAFNVVIALIFPTLFSVAAFAYVSWVFPGSGWSFYAAPAESLAAWSAGVTDLFGGGFTGVDALDAAFAFIIALALGAPLALATVWHIRRRQPLVAPAIVLAAATVTAAAISVATGWFGDPAAVAVAAPVLSAVMLIRIPEARAPRGRMLTLLALGWLGGALALALVDPRAVAQLGSAGLQGDRNRLEALNLGHAIAGRDGILVDTDNAPAVVVGRGDAVGLLSPGDERFFLALLFGRLNAHFVAVPDPQTAAGQQDRINRSFPSLFRLGRPDYRLVYRNTSWRLYERI